MDYQLKETVPREAERRIEQLTERAFLAAHLLTANPQQAENAVMEAIGSWDPERSSEEALFQQVLTIALRNCTERPPFRSSLADPAAALLPPELQAVLRLSARLRHCYVLRVLAGLSRQTSAGLLHLLCRQVDRYTNAAFKCLPFLAAQPNAGVEYWVWKKRLD